MEGKRAPPGTRYTWQGKGKIEYAQNGSTYVGGFVDDKKWESPKDRDCQALATVAYAPNCSTDSQLFFFHRVPYLILAIYSVSNGRNNVWNRVYWRGGTLGISAYLPSRFHPHGDPFHTNYCPLHTRLPPS